jgi:hypothetical protein
MVYSLGSLSEEVGDGLFAWEFVGGVGGPIQRVYRKRALFGCWFWILD